MIQIIKYAIGFLIAIYIYENVCAVSHHQTEERKKLVIFPKDGQILSENELDIRSEEGKREFHKQMGWLRDVCEDYAAKQYENIKNSR